MSARSRLPLPFTSAYELGLADMAGHVFIILL